MNSDQTLLLSILKLKFPKKTPQTFKNKELQVFLNFISFPCYSSSDYTVISSRSIKKNLFSEYLKELHYFFPFVPTILDMFFDYDSSDSNEKFFISCYVLCSFISWRLYVEFTGDFQHLKLILDSLANAIESQNESIVYNAYANSLQYYLLTSSSFEYSFFFSSLIDLSYRESDCFELFLPLLVSITKKSIKNSEKELSEDVEVFLKYSVEMLRRADYNQNDATALIDQIKHLIVQLNHSSLMIFSLTIPILPDKTITSVFQQVLGSVFNEILSSDPIIKTEKVRRIDNTNHSISFDTVSYIFSNIFGCDDPIECPIDTCYTDFTFHWDLMPTNIYLISECIISAIQKSDNAMCIFLSTTHSIFVSQKNHACLNDVLWLYIHVCSFIKLSRENSILFLKSILCTSVFQTDFWLFPYKNNHIISSIRKNSLTVLSKSGFSCIIEVFEYCYLHPLIFYDMISEILLHFPYIDIKFYSEPKFADLLGKACIYYMNMSLKNESELKMVSLHNLRCIIMFISNCFNEQSLLNVFFSNSSFSKSILYMFFDHSLKCFAKKCFRVFLSYPSFIFAPSLVIGLNDLLKTTIDFFPKEESITTGLDLIEIINSSINKKKSLSYQFEGISALLMVSISMLQSTKLSHQYFLHVMSFIGNQFNVTPLIKPYIVLISETVKRLRNEEYSIQMEKLITRILFGKSDEEVTELNPIKEGSMFTVLFEMAKDDNAFIKYLNMAKRISEKSPFNISSLINGGVDIYLLDRLQGYKNNDTNKKILVQSICNLLSVICSYQTSKEVTKGILMLLYPDNSVNLTFYYDIFLNMMFSIISNSINSNVISLPCVSNSSYIEINGIEIPQQHTLVVSFSIFLEPLSNESEISFFEIIDSKKSRICFSFYITKVIINKIEKKVHLPVGEWFKVVITIKSDPQGTHVTFNHIQDNSFYIFLKETPLIFSKLIIKSNSTIIPKNSTPIGYYCDILLSSSKNNQNVSENNNSPICNINFFDESGIIKARIKSIQPSLSLTYSGPHINVPTKFLKVLCNQIGIDKLFIILLYIDNYSINNSNQFLTMSIDIFILAFKSLEVQNCFLEKKCTETMFYMLYTKKKYLISYQLYLMIFSLYKCIDLLALKHNFLKDLVFNVALWLRSDPDQFLLISDHWVSEVLSENQDHGSNSIYFIQFLEFIHNCDFPEYIMNIRVLSNISTILNNMTSKEYVPFYLSVLIAKCLISNCVNKIIIYINLIKDYMQNMINITESFIVEANHISNLIFINTYSNNIVFLSIIDTLIVAHMRHIISTITFSQYISMIMKQLPQELHCKEVMNGLIQRINNGCFVLLPLMCLIASSLGNDYVYEMSLNLVFPPNLVLPLDSLMWLLISFTVSAFETRKSLFSVIYKQEHLSDICSLCHIIHSTDPRVLSPIISDFLFIGIDYVLSNKISDELCIKQLLKHSYLAILYHPKNYANHIFFELLGEFESKPNNSLSNKIISIWDIIDQCVVKLEKGIEYCYFLKINIDGHWDDIELAKKCLLIFEKYIFKDFVLYDILLTGILCRFDREFVQNHNKMVSCIFDSQIPPRALGYLINNLTFNGITVPLGIPNLGIQTNGYLYFQDFLFYEPMYEHTKYVSQQLYSIYISHNSVKLDNSKLSNKLIITITSQTLEKDIEIMNDNLLRSKNQISNVEKYFHDFVLLNKMSRPLFFQRDDFYHAIYGYCKLKPDLEYNNHLQASKNRDFGVNTNYLLDGDKKIVIGDSPIVWINMYKEQWGQFSKNESEIVLTFSSSSIHVLLSKIAKVYKRDYLHKPIAIEIFTSFGESYFLVFQNEKLPKLNYDNDSLDEWTNLWVNDVITNYEYLISLNHHSSRSFNVFSQYPIFPWVLSNYSSSSLDFNNHSIYRDYRSPIAALNSDRKTLSEKKYSKGFPINQAPICPMMVYTWFIRQEPFSSHHIRFQGGKFDHSSRLFHSIEGTYSNPSVLSELVPEFFYSPEFLLNMNNYDLGTSSSGNVVLPKWASTPFEFVYLHRKALESDYTSTYLNFWIDIIWGIEQGSKLNKYHPSMYETVWSTLSDKERIEETEAVLKETGQIPKKLFFAPHPFKKVSHLMNPVSSRFSVYLSKNKYKSYIFMWKEGSIHGLVVLNTGLLCRFIISSFSLCVIESSSRAFDISDCISLSTPIGKNDFAFVSKNGYEIGIVGFGGSQNQRVFQKVVNIQADNQYIVTQTADSQLLIWNLFVSKQSICSLNSYLADISSFDIKASFDLVAFSTTSSYIKFASIRHQSIINSVFVNDSQPKILQITQVWGFVLVYAEAFEGKAGTYGLYLFSVNGSLIKKTLIEKRIRYMCSGYRRSIDYIAILSEDNEIFLFEAFYIKVGSPLCKLPKHYERIYFVGGQNIIIATSENGDIEVIPY